MEYSEKAVLATASQASKEEPAGRYRYPQISSAPTVVNPAFLRIPEKRLVPAPRFSTSDLQQVGDLGFVNAGAIQFPGWYRSGRLPGRANIAITSPCSLAVR